MSSLFDRIYSCIAALNIGSAMGAPGWSAERLQSNMDFCRNFCRTPIVKRTSTEAGAGVLRERRRMV